MNFSPWMIILLWITSFHARRGIVTGHYEPISLREQRFTFSQIESLSKNAHDSVDDLLSRQPATSLYSPLPRVYLLALAYIANRLQNSICMQNGTIQPNTRSKNFLPCIQCRTTSIDTLWLTTHQDMCIMWHWKVLSCLPLSFWVI